MIYRCLLEVAPEVVVVGDRGRWLKYEENDGNKWKYGLNKLMVEDENEVYKWVVMIRYIS